MYDENAVWHDALPEPAAWMHQKFGEDPALELNEEQLVEQIRNVLK